jgi:hypothetical protein
MHFANCESICAHLLAELQNGFRFFPPDFGWPVAEDDRPVKVLRQ